MKPLVYIAGPLTLPSPMANTHTALRFGMELIDEDVITPFIPHLSTFWDIVTPRPYDWWLQYDFDVIRRCDGLLRSVGDSAGADAEVDFAERHGKPVFLSVEHCYTWARRWSANRSFASTHAVPS